MSMLLVNSFPKHLLTFLCYPPSPCQACLPRGAWRGTARRGAAAGRKLGQRDELLTLPLNGRRRRRPVRSIPLSANGGPNSKQSWKTGIGSNTINADTPTEYPVAGGSVTPSSQ